jgi:hypothetical protein
MNPLRCVTLIGADDSVEPKTIIEFASRHPLVEIGLLFGDRWGRSRFPSQAWVDELSRLVGALPDNQKPRLACHLCGSYARDFLMFEYPPVPFEHLWGRIQINTEGTECPVILSRLFKTIQRFARNTVWIIFQLDGVNDDLFGWALAKNHLLGAQVSVRLDAKNEITSRQSAHPDRFSGAFFGYAGDFSPQNLKENLHIFTARSREDSLVVWPFWVEVGWHMRRPGSSFDSVFDLAGAEEILRLAEEFTGKTQL